MQVSKLGSLTVRIEFEDPFREDTIMTFNPLLLTLWAALAAAFYALLLYRGQITRYEDDQLFLNEELNLHEQERQRKILRRVRQIAPAVRIAGGAAGILTAVVVGMYVFNAWVIIQN
jgi:hypothetical protein